MKGGTARVRAARDLGAVIAEARGMHEWTQTELAEKVGIDRSYLARLETGQSVKMLERVFLLLRALNVEVYATYPEADMRAEVDRRSLGRSPSGPQAM